MKSVGIDIGSTSIKIVEIQQSNKGLIVSKFKVHPFGENPAFDPAIEILEFLRNLANSYKAEKIQLVVGLRQEMVAVRNKIFPFSDRLKILRSLPFELEEDLPFSPENAVYDAKIIKTMGNSAEVLACAAPKHRISEALARLQDSGLDISLLSAEGLALANCWEKWNEPPPHQSTTQIQTDGQARPDRDIRLVLEMGHRHSLVCAFENNNLVGVRSIMYGGKNLTDLIAKKYELPYMEALRVMQGRAFILLSQDNASYDQLIFSQTICESLKELTRDLQMTILEFQSEFNGRVLGLSLIGGLSRIQNLHPYLTTQLEIPVNPVNILSGTFATAFEVSPDADATCGVALGLAIEGLKKPRNPATNFLRSEFQRKDQKLAAVWNRWGTLSKYVAALLVVLIVHSALRDDFSSSAVEKSTEALKIQAKEVAKLPSKQANEAGIKKYLKDQRKQTQEIKEIQSLAHMNSALEILSKISDAAPGKSSATLTVRKVVIQNNRVTVEGTVARPQDVSIFQNSLGRLSTTGKVETLRSTMMTSTGIPFAFGFNVDRGISNK